MNNERKIIDSVETLESALASLKEAEKKFSTYTQEQVDKIFLAAASAANKARIPLARWRSKRQAWALLKTRS